MRTLGNKRAATLLLLLTATACASEGELEGSLSDAYRLGHDDVRARLYASELAIEYARDDGSVPVRVTLKVRDMPPAGGERYDLGDHGAVTGQLSDGTEIPAFIDGSLKLDEFKPEDGARVRGSFDATFDGVRDTLGLRGDFDTRLEVVDWPRQPDAGTADGGQP